MGNTFAMVNSTGTLLGVAGFGAWGKPLSSSLPSTPFAWKGQAGQFTDSETGNVYCQRRYYSPKLGRWLSRDPIGFAGGINLYAYCGGDPVNFADPSGLQTGLEFLPTAGMTAEEIAAAEAAAAIAKAATQVGSGAVVGAEVAETGYVLAGGAELVTTSEVFAATGTGLSMATGVGEVVVAGVAIVAAYHAIDSLLNEEVVATASPMIRATYSHRTQRQETKDNVKGGGCFVAGTLVQMADGSVKSIEQVKAGEQVVSRDEVLQMPSVRHVLKTTVRTVDMVVKVTLADVKTGQVVETLTATRNHPFYVSGKGFVVAGALGVGNAIVTRAGPAVVVVKLEYLRRPEGFAVYNFEVEGDHTYFVGKANGGAWVHNGTYDCFNHLEGNVWGEAVANAMNGNGEDIHWADGVQFRSPTGVARPDAMSADASALYEFKSGWNPAKWQTRVSGQILEGARVANDLGKTYTVISKGPIPDYALRFMMKHGIGYRTIQ